LTSGITDGQFLIHSTHGLKKEGVVASWLVRLSLDPAFWVEALSRDIALCSWARHLTLTALLSTQVYKWVLVNLMLGEPCDGLAFHPGGGGYS